MTGLSGGQLAGGNPARGRVQHDYYATDPASTRALLARETFPGTILEPCCGEGHISEVLKEAGYEVFSKRQAPIRNGMATDENGCAGRPEIEWI